MPSCHYFFTADCSYRSVPVGPPMSTARCTNVASAQYWESLITCVQHMQLSSIRVLEKGSLRRQGECT